VDGELHRLLTAPFTHLGLLHLVFNTTTLWGLRGLEWELGAMAFARLIIIVLFLSVGLWALLVHALVVGFNLRAMVGRGVAGCVAAMYLSPALRSVLWVVAPRTFSIPYKHRLLLDFSVLRFSGVLFGLMAIAAITHPNRDATVRILFLSFPLGMVRPVTVSYFLGPHHHFVPIPMSGSTIFFP
jgi:membrane associated rhomboid family serine protease